MNTLRPLISDSAPQVLQRIDFAPADADAIERATLAAVAPEKIEEYQGWLIPYDTGTVGRAKSATPLWHADADLSTVQAIAQRYAQRKMRATFRVSDHPRFDVIRDVLRSEAFQPMKPAWVQIARTSDMCNPALAQYAELAQMPDLAWAALFLGEGFDPVDGASRVKTLSRAKGTLYASIRENGATVAAGAAAFSEGWMSVHGMRTAVSHRAKGLATRILHTMAAEAIQRGIQRCFLQVEEGNLSAQSVYRRAGFQTAWRYAYFESPVSSV